MTLGAVRISAIALGVAAMASLSPPSASATVVHHSGHAIHRHVAHPYAHRYAWRHGHPNGYGYGDSPGAAAAAGVIGAVIGLAAAASYPYPCDGFYSGPRRALHPLS
jgi:hypothetical protein